LTVDHTPFSNHNPDTADPNLETAPNYAGPEFEIIREGLRHGYHKDDQQVIECLLAAWQADRTSRIAVWNARKEADAHAAEEAEEICRVRDEEEEAVANEVANHERQKRKGQR
ncbi:hypothetical protein PAXRUDRAFT_176373, partial [Paxillus rubicundulus Ve08.2h10]